MGEREKPLGVIKAETPARQIDLEIFAGEFGIEIEILAEIAKTDDDDVLILDPFMMGLDRERTFEKLDRDEQLVMKREIFKRLGIDAKNLQAHHRRRYQTEQWVDLYQNIRQETVDVFESPRPEFTGIGLHMIHYDDGDVRWGLGKIDVNSR